MFKFQMYDFIFPIKKALLFCLVLSVVLPMNVEARTYNFSQAKWNFPSSTNSLAMLAKSMLNVSDGATFVKAIEILDAGEMMILCVRKQPFMMLGSFAYRNGWRVRNLTIGGVYVKGIDSDEEVSPFAIYMLPEKAVEFMKKANKANIAVETWDGQRHSILLGLQGSTRALNNC